MGTSIVIPNSVKTIKAHAFNESENLVSVTLGSGLEEIEVNAFSLCSRLVEVYNLTSFNIRKNYSDYGQVAQSAYVVHNSLNEESIIDDTDSGYTVCYYGGIATLIVDKNDFEDQDHGGLGYEVTLPNSIKFHGTTINSYEIGSDLFNRLWYMKKVTMPNAVTIIGDSAFEYCGRLETVVFSKNLTKIGRSAFFACNALDNVVIPNGVTEIGSNAFNDCDELKNIIIPDSVTKIGANAFAYCKKLATIVLPSNLTTLEWGIFSDCESLVSVIIPDSVTKIGGYAFYKNANLEYIVLPVGITTIDTVNTIIFSYCPKLEIVYYRGTSNWDSENDIIKERLAEATIYYYSETQPSTTGNYWHYDSTTNEPVVWNVE